MLLVLGCGFWLDSIHLIHFSRLTHIIGVNDIVLPHTETDWVQIKVLKIAVLVVQATLFANVKWQCA